MPLTESKWTAEIAQGWRQRQLAGETLGQIGAQYNIGNERVRQVMHKFGVESSRPPLPARSHPPKKCQHCKAYYTGDYDDHRVTAEHKAAYGWDIDAAYRDYLTGMRVEAVADRHGVSIPAMFRTFKRMKFQLRGKGADAGRRAWVKRMLRENGWEASSSADGVV